MSKNKKKYNAKKQTMVKARLIAGLAIELQNIVASVAEKQGDNGNLQMYVVENIAEWWINQYKIIDKARHHLRLAARDSYLKVVRDNAKKDKLAQRKARKELAIMR